MALVQLGGLDGIQVLVCLDGIQVWCSDGIRVLVTVVLRGEGRSRQLNRCLRFKVIGVLLKGLC